MYTFVPLILKFNQMRANAPKSFTLIIAVILALLGIAGYFFVSALAGVSFWLLLAGFVVLLAGNLLKGL